MFKTMQHKHNKAIREEMSWVVRHYWGRFKIEGAVNQSGYSQKRISLTYTWRKAMAYLTNCFLILTLKSYLQHIWHHCDLPVTINTTVVYHLHLKTLWFTDYLTQRCTGYFYKHYGELAICINTVMYWLYIYKHCDVLVIYKHYDVLVICLNTVMYWLTALWCTIFIKKTLWCSTFINTVRYWLHLNTTYSMYWLHWTIWFSCSRVNW